MPWIQRWIDPKSFLLYKKVRIYHCYKEDDWANGPLEYWYSNNALASNEEDAHVFDVRDLQAWNLRHRARRYKELTTIQVVRFVLRLAIDRKELSNSPLRNR